MTIYHFLLDHRVGGPHVYTQSLKEAVRDDMDFMVITAGRSSAANISLTNLRLISNYLYPLEILVNVILILLHVFRGRINVKNSIFDVHCAANLAPIIAARILRKEVVWHFHETVPGFYRLARLGIRLLKSTPHRLVAVTEKCIEVFSLKNALVLAAPVNLDYWKPGNELNTDSDQPLKILCTANLNPLKGQDILLKAVFEIQENCTLNFIGQRLETQKEYSKLLDQLAEQVKAINPKIQINFFGWQDQGQVKELLKKNDVFVLPSRSEAHPIALVEAMAMELVVIGTDVGGVSKIIKSPDVGFLVKKEQPEAIQEALQKIFKMNTSSRRQIGQAARKHIESRFSPVEIGNKHIELYTSLILSK